MKTKATRRVEGVGSWLWAWLWLGWLALLGARPAAVAGPVPVGGVSPDFQVIQWNSTQTVRLSDYAGKIVVLDFFAYWCPPCVASSPDVEQNIQRYFDARGGNDAGIPVVVLSINIEPQNPPATQAFIANGGLHNVVNDYSGVAWNLYNVENGIPLFVVLNGVANSPSHKAWEVLHSSAGYPGSAYLRTVINSVRAPVVALPPSIASQPASFDATEGGSGSLSVSANGASPLAYQWFKNGTEMPGETSSVLAFPTLRPSDAAVYRVRVSNTLGTADSAEARVRVFPATTVTLADPVLDRAVRDKLGVPTGSISLLKMSQLKDLDVTNGVVQSLFGLRQATALERLRVRTTGLADLRDIEGLSSLKSLSITQPGDAPQLDALQTLTGLESLALPSSRVVGPLPLGAPGRLATLSLGRVGGRSVEWLAGLGGLTNLSLLGVEADDLRPLGNLSRLQTLVLAKANANDWAWLGALPGVASLELDACNLDTAARIPATPSLVSLTLKNMPGLALPVINAPALRNLRVVGMGWSKLPQAAWFEALPSLYFLDLTGNRLESLEGLAAAGVLGRIRYLYASDNALTQVEELRDWSRAWGVDLRGNYLDLAPESPVAEVLDLLRATAFVWVDSQVFPLSSRCVTGAGGRWRVEVAGRAGRRVRIDSGPALDSLGGSQTFVLTKDSEVFEPAAQPGPGSSTWFFKVTAVAE